MNPRQAYYQVVRTPRTHFKFVAHFYAFSGPYAYCTNSAYGNDRVELECAVFNECLKFCDGDGFYI